VHLLLFDIDGTLLHPGPMARHFMGQAIEEFTGQHIKLMKRDVIGSTDPLIIKTVLENLLATPGMTASLQQDILDRYMQLMLANYAGDQTPKYLFPGTRRMLQYFRERDDCILGLITGNLERMARLKLELFGIWQYFEVGAYSSDGEFRSELPPLASAKARDLCGEDISPGQTWVIGDTLSDHQAAVDNHMRSVLVGHEKEADYKRELIVAGPDLYLESFIDLTPWIEMLDP